MTDPIPAATLILLRDRAGAPPELLMVERARTMAFAGGAAVFPGGRVDPGDRALAAAVAGDGDDADDLAARIAAIRETIEEAGIPVGLVPSPSGPALARLRARLAAGEPFGAALAEAGATLAPDALTPFARWLPSHAPVRVFDARFYLARLPADAPPVAVDGMENARAFWTTAADLLAAADRGEATIIFPTRRNLERLALFPDFAAATADAARHPVRTITPWTERLGGVDWLRIPDDLGYPVVAERLDRATRG